MYSVESSKVRLTIDLTIWRVVLFNLVLDNGVQRLPIGFAEIVVSTVSSLFEGHRTRDRQPRVIRNEYLP